MVEIGIRELRTGLSSHVASVRDGGTVTVTDHGRPVARSGPVDVAAGAVRPARTTKRPAPEPLVIDGTISDLLTDQRR